MIDMHSKYDNMHKNGMFYALICINNHIIACVNFMLSMSSGEIVDSSSGVSDDGGDSYTRGASSFRVGRSNVSTRENEEHEVGIGGEDGAGGGVHEE